MPIDLALRINGLRIACGMPLVESELAKGGFGKAGFLIRFHLHAIIQESDALYWVKNPDFSFFDEKVTASANLHIPRGSGWDSDFINGTSAFLVFKDGEVRSVIVQVINSYIHAQGFIEDFRKTAASALGTSICSDVRKVPHRLPRRSLFRSMTAFPSFPLKCVWTSDTQTVVSQLAASGKVAFVQWSRKS